MFNRNVHISSFIMCTTGAILWSPKGNPKAGGRFPFTNVHLGFTTLSGQTAGLWGLLLSSHPLPRSFPLLPIMGGGGCQISQVLRVTFHKRGLLLLFPVGDANHDGDSSQ